MGVYVYVCVCVCVCTCERAIDLQFFQAGEICLQSAKSIDSFAMNILALGGRVLVVGLRDKQQYNGLEGILVKFVGDSRIHVRLDQGKKILSLKQENVCTQMAKAVTRKKWIRQIQDLIRQNVAINKEALAIALKTTGPKHMNTANAYFALARAYSMTFKPADARESVSMLKRANWIRQHAGDDTEDIIPRALSDSREIVAQFDALGILSSMPYCWGPTSRREDEVNMRALFPSLLARHGNDDGFSMSSAVMERGLRRYGLFNFRASSSAPVCFVCVCVCECVCVCVCVCMYIYIQISTGEKIYIYIYTYEHTYTCTYIYIYINK